MGNFCEACCQPSDGSGENGRVVFHGYAENGPTSIMIRDRQDSIRTEQDRLQKNVYEFEEQARRNSIASAQK